MSVGYDLGLVTTLQTMTTDGEGHNKANYKAIARGPIIATRKAFVENEFFNEKSPIYDELPITLVRLMDLSFFSRMRLNIYIQI